MSKACQAIVYVQMKKRQYYTMYNYTLKMHFHYIKLKVPNLTN